MAAHDRKFEALDGLRGVAALLVFGFHVQDQVGQRVIPHGDLSVDLFFILSGFVVAHAYGGRLRAGWGVRSFMAARLRRLYPLYILGLALGLGVVVLLHGWSPRLIMLSSIGAFFVPMFLTDPWLYPLNIASWSLACEFAINAAYGLIAPNLTGRRLGFAVAAGAAALAIAVPYHGSSNAGAEGKDILIGYARVLFGFPTGVLLYRLYRRGRLQWLAGAPPGLLVAAFVALALLPRLSPWLDLLTILAVLPALIAAGAQAAEPTGLERRSYAVLAAISYPLYVTHQPVLAAISGLIKTSVPSSGLVACCISAGLLIAVAAELLFDRPLRQRRKALAAAST